MTLENVFCDTELINCGVPQGSIVGLIGSNLYADDKCIYYQDRDVEKTEKVLNKEFLSLCEWL